MEDMKPEGNRGKTSRGIQEVSVRTFSWMRELFTRLSQKPEPRALFITCSDSRVDLSLLTQT